VDEAARNRVARMVGAAGDRIKVAGDILDYSYFFVPDAGLTYDEKAFVEEFGKPGAVEVLTRFAGELAEAEPFDAARLETVVQWFVAAQGIKVGQLIHALRIAETGKAVGFGLYDTLAILGRQSCLARIGIALEKARSGR